jgi:hypothetical protein
MDIFKNLKEDLDFHNILDLLFYLKYQLNKNGIQSSVSM